MSVSGLKMEEFAVCLAGSLDPALRFNRQLLYSVPTMTARSIDVIELAFDEIEAIPALRLLASACLVWIPLWLALIGAVLAPFHWAARGLACLALIALCIAVWARRGLAALLRHRIEQVLVRANKELEGRVMLGQRRGRARLFPREALPCIEVKVPIVMSEEVQCSVRALCKVKAKDLRCIVEDYKGESDEDSSDASQHETSQADCPALSPKKSPESQLPGCVRGKAGSSSPAVPARRAAGVEGGESPELALFSE